MARTLGKTVGELLAQISSHELTEWQALARIENRGAQSPETDPEKVERDLRALFGRPRV